MQTLKVLIMLTDEAMAGDVDAIHALRTLGEALAIAGGAAAMCKLQGALHDYAVEHYRMGSRGDRIGNFWEHIPEWANL